MKNKITSQIIIMGVFVFGIFVYIATINLIDNRNSSKNFFSKDKTINAKIEKYYVENNKLIVEVSGNAKSVCIKTTKSNPQTSSICWIDVKNNQVSTSIYDYKSYYIWIKDNNGNISDAEKYDYK